MTANIANQVSYLRTSRNFPQDLPTLVVEINKSYVDIASAVNSRTIGIFSITQASITGEQWFTNSSQRQQTLRQVFNFTSAGNIAHGLNFKDISQFTKAYGSYTDGTNYYGVIYATSVGIAGQVTFSITPQNIVILQDPAAPPITRGAIVLEWLAPV